jgi:hypothetical protein
VSTSDPRATRYRGALVIGRAEEGALRAAVVVVVQRLVARAVTDAAGVALAIVDGEVTRMVVGIVKDPD